MRKDPLNSLRRTIRHERTRARAFRARLKRGALVVLAVATGVAGLAAQNGGGVCLRDAATCEAISMQGASVSLVPAAAQTALPRAAAPNPAMAAALAARAAPVSAAGRTELPRVNPAMAAARASNTGDPGRSGLFLSSPDALR